jgi:hypothetical protein
MTFTLHMDTANRFKWRRRITGIMLHIEMPLE